ncbi:MAG: hypothetical protein QM687_15875 [Ferruginibacter sp.]
MQKQIVFLLLAFISLHSFAQLPAFPGAEGFGALATGGRGSDVYHVTNLNDSGKGSLREAVSQPNRTVVFDVGGVIKIKERINVESNITIAGQTAPGEGITVYGYGMGFSGQKNIIVRYITLHGSISMPRGKCVLTADSAENMIFDHLSVQWGRWDNLHIKQSSNITLQYCIIGESIDPQRFGALLERPKNLSVHHCLWIDNQSRNPKAKAAIEYINNVIYNWGSSGFVGGHSAEHHYQDIINNYFIAGPNSKDSFLSLFTKTDHVYHSGNIVDMNKDGQLNGRLIADSDFLNKGADLVQAKQNIPPVKVTTSSPAEALQAIIRSAGNSLHRDEVDKRLIGYLQSTGTTGMIVKNEQEAGGQPPVKNGAVLKDSDGDGIPDKAEQKMKLNAKNKKDAAIIQSSGYSNLELYLNDLAK